VDGIPASRQAGFNPRLSAGKPTAKAGEGSHGF